MVETSRSHIGIPSCIVRNGVSAPHGTSIFAGQTCAELNHGGRSFAFKVLFLTPINCSVYHRLPIRGRHHQTLRNRTNMRRHAAIILLSATLLPAANAAANTPADLVVTEARIYTASDHGYAEALAVSGDRLVYVGSKSGAAEWIGPATKVENLHGRLVLPGIIDSHIHPSGIVDLDVCDLDSKAKSLGELTVFVRGCIERYKIPAGEWVNVRQWNFADNNRPDSTHPTLRAALDLASTQHPIQLLGNDGHHGAFNSMALARAKNAKGERIGFTRATLATDFAAVARLVGVDANGAPNGTANEEARYIMDATFMLFVDLPEVMKAGCRGRAGTSADVRRAGEERQAHGACHARAMV